MRVIARAVVAVLLGMSVIAGAAGADARQIEPADQRKGAKVVAYLEWVGANNRIAYIELRNGATFRVKERRLSRHNYQKVVLKGKARRIPARILLHSIHTKFD
jgi:hypothetical protein